MKAIHLPQFQVTLRSVLLAICLILVLTTLVYELYIFAPVLAEWHPFDYEMYVTWGEALRAGRIDHYYPLPTTFWVFAPLSLLPDPFKFVFALAPFLFVLKMFGRKGLVLWLYLPLLTQAQFGQLDGWLLFPLLWLVQDRPFWAPLGAVLLCVKPILAPFAIACALMLWLWHRRRNMLAQFGAMMLVFLLPAFVLDPFWIPHFIQALPLRATHPYLQFRGVSVWTWWNYGGITQLLFPFLIAMIGGLTLYLVRRRENPIRLAELWNQFSFPYLYQSNLTLTLPLLSTPRELAILTASSWIAAGLDVVAGGWGGAYALIPLAALTLLALSRGSLRNPAPQPELRAQVEVQGQG